MKVTSSQLYFAACNIFSNADMSIERAIGYAKEIADKIEETDNVIPLNDVKDAVEFIIRKYNRAVSKYTLTSILQGEYGYARQEAESMVDRCEFHGFIENIGTETKTLYKLKTE